MRPGRAADHSPPSSAAVMEGLSYTSTHPLGHTGPVTGSLYPLLFFKCYIVSHTSSTEASIFSAYQSFMETENLEDPMLSQTNLLYTLSS